MTKIGLLCNDQDCDVAGGRSFFFSDKEQAFYKDKGYAEPKRCWECRTRRRQDKNSDFAIAIEKAKNEKKSTG